MNKTDPGYRFSVEMNGAERDDVLRQHLNAAEKKFKEATGQGHLYFGVVAANYYAEWLMLLAPDQAAEFLQAVIAQHGTNDKKKYAAATARLKRARIALHVELRLMAEKNAANDAATPATLQ